MNYQPQTVDMLLAIQRPTPIQGWQCPICSVVWSPWIQRCQECECKKPNGAAEQ